MRQTCEAEPWSHGSEPWSTFASGYTGGRPGGEPWRHWREATVPPLLVIKDGRTLIFDRALGEQHVASLNDGPNRVATVASSPGHGKRGSKMLMKQALRAWRKITVASSSGCAPLDLESEVNRHMDAIRIGVHAQVEAQLMGRPSRTSRCLTSADDHVLGGAAPSQR